MAKSSWYAEKRRKVQKYDAEVARRNADNDVWRDHFEGRAVWSPDLTRSSWDAYRYEKLRMQPTSREKWAITVMRSVGIDVTIRQRKKQEPHTGLWFPVYLENGGRIMCRTLDEAIDKLASRPDAVRLWNGMSQQYLFK